MAPTTEQKNILYLEDEQTIAEVTIEYFKMQNYHVKHVTSGDAAVKAFKNKKYDLVILDIMVPTISGLEVLAKIRKEDTFIPVIMLSALGDEATQLQAFNTAADDYIIKPYSPILLMKRIEVLLNRLNIRTMMMVYGLEIDTRTYQAYYDSISLGLTLTEFLILQLLHDNPQQVFTRVQLLENVFADDYYPNDRVIDAHIKNLRKKLPKDYIKTIIGVGYQFQDVPEEQ